jgi:hypothetical protein
MVSRKCLATLRRPSTTPTFRAISASLRSGLRVRVAAAWIFARSFSDAASRSDVAPGFRTGRFFSYAAFAMVMSTLACAGVRYPTLEWRRCRL